MRMKIALALTSAVFMMMWVSILIGSILYSLSVVITLHSVFFALIYLLSIISFLGSVLFLLEARKVLPRWYLAVPLCICLFMLVIVNFWMIFSGKELLSDHIGIVETFGLTLLMLLSPFSTLLFLSLHRQPDSMNAYLGVLSVVSMFSIVLLCSTLNGLLDALSNGGPTFDAVVAFQGLYWFYLMPIVGICFLVRAITYRNPRNIQSPVTVKPTQN